MADPYHMRTEINNSIHAKDALEARVHPAFLLASYVRTMSAASFHGALAAKLCGVI